MSLLLPLEVLAGVLLEELVRAEICPVTDVCLSGLFLVGEVRLVELGSGAHLQRGVSGGVQSVSGSVPGGVNASDPAGHSAKSIQGAPRGRGWDRR